MTIHRLVLADESPVLLRALMDVVDVAPDFQVVGLASSAPQALALLKRLKPDIAVVELAMPAIGGVAALAAIASAGPGIRTVFLTEPASPARRSEALARGAWGTLERPVAATQLIDCLRTIARGDRWIHDPNPIPALAPPSIRIVRRVHLTPREREIVDLLRRGLSNRAIADQVGTAEGTVKIHLHNVFRKAKVTNRTALAAACFEGDDRV